jgi:hypothetical protein
MLLSLLRINTSGIYSNDCYREAEYTCILRGFIEALLENILEALGANAPNIDGVRPSRGSTPTLTLARGAVVKSSAGCDHVGQGSLTIRVRKSKKK